MGCRMLAAIEAPMSNARALLAEVPRWFAEWEHALSRFQNDSELTWLNQHAGEQVQVSAVLWEVVQESLLAARRSAGYVVPHLLNALEAIGYDRSFDQLATPALPVTHSWPAFQMHAWNGIEFNSRARTIKLPAGMRLDFGGIAKGWAADRALKRLAVYGPALVDAGGDVAAGAAPTGQAGWPVAIGDPLHSGENLGLLILSHVGVATSGRDYRQWKQGEVQRHHILDPHTGQPAQTDVLTATVVAPTARAAETAAKTVFILGSQAGLEWLEGQADLAGFIVRDDGQCLLSQSIHQYLWSAS